MIEDEEFFAWLDGELEGEAAARVAAEVEATPDLAAKAAAHRALRQRLHGAFAPVMDGSAPPRFEAEVVDLSEKRFSRDVRTSWLGAPQWLAMAATLVLGLAVGRLADLRPEGPIESHNGTIVAAASLDQALNQQLASAGPAD